MNNYNYIFFSVVVCFWGLSLYSMEERPDDPDGLDKSLTASEASIMPDWVQKSVPIVQYPWAAAPKELWQNRNLQKPPVLLREQQPLEILAAFDKEIGALKKEAPEHCVRIQQLEYIMHLFFKEAMQRGLPLYWRYALVAQEVPAPVTQQFSDRIADQAPDYQDTAVKFEPPAFCLGKEKRKSAQEQKVTRPYNLRQSSIARKKYDDSEQ